MGRNIDLLPEAIANLHNSGILSRNVVNILFPMKGLDSLMVISSIQTKAKLAWALVFICPAFFSSNMLLARGMAGVFPPLSLAFLRWLFVGLVIMAAMAALRRIKMDVIRQEIKPILFLASLGMGLCGGPVYLAGELTTATNIGLIYSTAPLLMAVIALFVFKQHLSIRQSCGLLMGLVGVLIILFKADPALMKTLSFNRGDILIVLATFSFSIYSLGLKYFKTTLTQVQRFGCMALGGALWHAPFVIWEVSARGPWPEFTAAIIAGLFIAVFFASIGAYLSYGFIVVTLGTAIASATLYLSPIYAAILAALLLDEQIMIYHLMGGALILPGLWLVSGRQ